MAYALGDQDSIIMALGDGWPEDDADVYSNWAAQIKGMGGSVTVLPGNLVAVDGSSSTSVFQSMINSQAVPAAKFTAARAAALGLVSPDYRAPDGSVYFVAPADVQAYVANNGIQVGGLAQSPKAIEKGDAANQPDWFKKLSAVTQTVTVVAIGAGVLYGLSLLPRPHRE